MTTGGKIRIIVKYDATYSHITHNGMQESAIVLQFSATDFKCKSGMAIWIPAVELLCLLRYQNYYLYYIIDYVHTIHAGAK